MPAQDGLRFLFDIQDKITAKLAKIEAKSKSSAAKIDKAFTRASRSQEKNSARAVAAEQKRIAAVNKAHAQAIKLLKRESDAFKQSMTRLASAASVAFAAVAAKSLSMAGDYDAAMRSVQAKTGATGETLEKLTAQSREMGRTTVHSATEAARGQAFLAQAGFKAHEVLAALPGTLNLATAGELGLAAAADIASNVLTGFALNVSEADRVADVLALTANSANTNVQQMGDAMKYVATVSAAAGVDFEETSAAIGLLANAGFQGEMGGTALRGAMTKLLSPTKAAQKILDKLGISAISSTGGLKPLRDIVEQLEKANLSAADATKIFGQRAGPGMLGLVSQGSKALVKLTGELKNSEGAAKKAADIMGGGLWGAMKKFQSIAESAFISFGERLAPAVIWGANVFADLPGPIQEVVVVTGSLVAMMGGLMLVMPASFGSLVQLPAKLGRLAKMINIVKIKTVAMAVAQKAATAAQWLFNAALHANPIGLVIAAIGLLVVAWLKWDDEIKAFFRVTWRLVKKGFYAFKGWVTEAFGVLKGWLDKIPTPILALLGPVGLVLAAFKHWDDIKEIARSVYRGIRTWLGDRLGAIFKGIKKGIDSVVGFFGDMKDVIVGNSIVPDMVDDIESEFERMNFAMVSEVAEATRVTTVEFKNMGTGLHEAAVVMSTELYEAAKDLHEKEIELAEATRKLDEEQRAATQSASGYDLALAGLAGQMGGATGQALNLVIAMREHNKAQKAAAEAGRETEGEFSKIQVGAATLGLAFTAIGDAIGGTAGKVLSELGGIAQAFATGGIVGGIMAGIGSLIKGIKGLFGRGKKKRQAAAKAEADAAKIVADAAAAAAETHAEAVETLRRAWLSIPTDQIVLDLTAIRDAWNALGLGHRTVAFYDYAKSLISARDAGAALTAGELKVIALFEEYQGRRTAMLARHKAEMAVFDTQISTLESLLQTNISEVDALIAQQKAELDALSARQDAEISALATRRQAALDSMMSVQTQQLSMLKEMQSKELAEMQSAQAAQLSELKAARSAALGVVESAIQRELEDERIAAQLTIDLRKAGGDKGAIIAAKSRANESTKRLLERDELNALMSEAEERVRARYKDELDAINAHWDNVEAEKTKRFRNELKTMENAHGVELEALEATLALELAAHNTYWDDLEELMELQHSFELEALEASHKAQQQVLLDSLVERRDALRDSQAVELADLEDFYDAKIRVILVGQEKVREAQRNAEREDDARVVPENTDPFPEYPGFKDPEWFQGYQHGGPVQAGRPVLVGEAGPEIFIPSQSGRIDPNVSNSGGVDAKAIGRAVAAALEGTEIKVDGRKLGRLTVRHQPLAIAELGGRR